MEGQQRSANSGVGLPKASRDEPSRRSSSAILQRTAERQRPSGLDSAPPHPSGRGRTLPPFTTAPPQEPRLVAASFHSPSLERPSSPCFYFYRAGCLRRGSGLPKRQQGQKPAASLQQVAGWEYLHKPRPAAGRRAAHARPLPPPPPPSPRPSPEAWPRTLAARGSLLAGHLWGGGAIARTSPQGPRCLSLPSPGPGPD